MIENYSKKITQFYQISLVVIMLTTLGVVLYFWKLGFIDGSRAKDLHKSSYILETYEKKRVFSEVKTLIKEENPKLSIKRIKEMETDFEKVNTQVEVPEFNELKVSLQNLKNGAAALISFPKVEKVQKVFNEKLVKFYDFVKTNQWRTLTRMSDRIFSQTKGHLNIEKIDDLAKTINRDFTSMIKITENSILTRKDKAEVISRINNLQVEVDMMAKYAAGRSAFYQKYNSTEETIKSWLDSVAPELTLQKIKVEQIGRYYVMGMLGIFSMVLITFLGSFIWNKWSFKRNKEEIEKLFEGVISENIIEKTPLKEGRFSPEFESFTRNMTSYFHKRMSFGSIFQDAMPFSSILLDHNLKVLWANKQFCEDWMITSDEINKEYMSWDFLNKLTNIGHDDPVLEALKNNIAGIYQVQVKPNDKVAARPYEMFVSPVKLHGESRIMLFFYDLTNIEETIQDQAKSLLAPIKKSLQLMEAGNLDRSEELEQEFGISGTLDIYDRFIDLNDKVTNDNQRLIDEVELLYNSIEKFENLVHELQGGLVKGVHLNKDKASHLKIFKDSVIGLAQLSKNLNQSFIRGREINNAGRMTVVGSTKKINELMSAANEMKEALPKFNKIKEELRDTKTQFQDSKSRLSHELSQMTIFMKRIHEPNGVEKVGRTFAKFSQTFHQVSEYATQLDRKISSLEVLISKAGLVFNATEAKLSAVNMEGEKRHIESCESYTKQTQLLASQGADQLADLEESIVDSLKSIFGATKQSLAVNTELIQMIPKQEILSEQTKPEKVEIKEPQQQIS